MGAELALPNLSKWSILPMKPRVDAFHYEELVRDVQNLRAQGCNRIALDVTSTRFMSLTAIRFLVNAAIELAEARGKLAFIGINDKTMRHFKIYGSLDAIMLVRVAQQLPEEGLPSAPPAPSSSAEFKA